MKKYLNEIEEFVQYLYGEDGFPDTDYPMSLQEAKECVEWYRNSDSEGFHDVPEMTAEEFRDAFNMLYENCNNCFDLLIVYKGGEIDNYYRRTAGQLWDSEYDIPICVLEEIAENDPETIQAIRENADQILEVWLAKADGEVIARYAVNELPEVN